MLELYFLFYWLPKKMTQLARERNRSAVAWSVIAIASWIGAEVGVSVTAGIVYAFGIELWGWEEPSTGAQFLIYLVALGTAIFSVTVVYRILRSKPRHEVLPAPPPPPQFSD
jgi:MFS family permease